MNKTEIKNSPSNKLIIRMVDLHSIIVSRNGVRCKGEITEENNVANELMNRGLLTKDDIDYLNM